MTIRVVLIDSEPGEREYLRELLNDHPLVTVVGEAEKASDACTLLVSSRYDLVFIDVRLNDDTGFNLVPKVRDGARVVFVTKCQEDALRAFEVNALDCFLKPVGRERLFSAIARFGTFMPAPPAAHDGRLCIDIGKGEERLVLIADISCITSLENYTQVSLRRGNERLLVRKTMKAWEELLPAEKFARVHRCKIVNIAHVAKLERKSSATFAIHVNGIAQPITASYRYISALRKRLSRQTR